MQMNILKVNIFIRHHPYLILSSWDILAVYWVLIDVRISDLTAWHTKVQVHKSHIKYLIWFDLIRFI